VFFTRFWQDRSADFRARPCGARWSAWPSARLPLRRKEVVELDTFALGELLDALGGVRTPADVEARERVAPVLGHVTRARISLPPNPTVEQAARSARAGASSDFDHAPTSRRSTGPARWRPP
jgi:hypothetical protein